MVHPEPEEVPSNRSLGQTHSGPGGGVSERFLMCRVDWRIIEAINRVTLPG